MDDQRAVVIPRIAEGMLQLFQVMSIHRADVLHSQFREHFSADNGVFHPLFQRMHHIKGAFTHPPHRIERTFTLFHHLVVEGLHPQVREVIRETTDGR